MLKDDTIHGLHKLNLTCRIFVLYQKIEIKKNRAIHPKYQPLVYLVVLLWKCEHLWAQVYDCGENIS